MRASSLNIMTLREDPSDTEIASHRLLTRSGMIHKSGSGLYLYGPLLTRVLRKVAAIIAEEMARVGGLEVVMPILQEQGLWERSGRWAQYMASRTMLSLKDRHGQVFGLAPTAEEVVTDYAAAVIQSYRQLPTMFFQQHTKFRDEIRPRFGLMRVKEFVMMDAYSFHADTACLDRMYQAVRGAYQRIFQRLGLEAFAVEADAGAIGGSGSHEFMVAASVGEDTIIYEPGCGYAANVERAVSRIPPPGPWAAPAEATSVSTPDIRTIAAVVTFLAAQYQGLGPEHLIKAVLYMARCDGSAAEFPVAAFVRGDREVNQIKLQNAVAGITGHTVLGLRPMVPAEILAATGAEPGFAGPGTGLTVDCAIADAILAPEATPGPMVAGANRTGYHLVGFDIRRDAMASLVYRDLTTVRADDACLVNGAPLTEVRGIEVGHVFKLGEKYSAPLEARFTGADGKLHPFVMGCYGIGTSRVVAAAVEQHHDADGIRWPVAIAPFTCVIVPVGRPGDTACATIAEDIYRRLSAEGVDVVLDDRDLKPGVKFKDWDLIGIPLRITIGRGVANGVVEFKARSEGGPRDVPIASAGEEALAWLRAAQTAAPSASPAATG